ncbi:MAG: alkaline phosphatase family protein [Acidobacteriota bacterium]
MKLKIVLVAVALLLGGAGWAVYSLVGSRPPADRVILLGMDGVAPNLLEPLVAQGKLPAFKRIMDEGCYGRFGTFRPTESGILWTSVATGMSMMKHGIIDWTHVEKTTGQQVPHGDSDRKVRTYWEILAERGIKTGTLNWWWSYPAPPIKNGYLVTDRFRLVTKLPPSPDTVYPREIFDEIKGMVVKGKKDVLAEAARRGIPEWKADEAQLPFGGSKRTLDAYPYYIAQDMTVEQVGDYLWEKHPVQVFSIYLRLIDVTCHFAWHFIDKNLYEEVYGLEKEGKLTEADVARIDLEFARVMAPVYQYMDRIVQKYLDRLDGRTALIICSDHGFMFSNGVYAHGNQAKEAPDGVVFYIGPGARKGHRIADADLYDIAPTILHLIGQPVAQDMDGRVLKEIFEDSYQSRYPVRTIATYESGERKTGQGSGQEQQMNKEILEDLQTLGYIEDSKSPDSNAAKDAQSQPAKKREKQRKATHTQRPK